VAAASAARDHGAFQPARVDVYFSPKGGAGEACADAIAAAKKTINVPAYSFTSEPDAAASEPVFWTEPTRPDDQRHPPTAAAAADRAADTVPPTPPQPTPQLATPQPTPRSLPEKI
jgi:hypothetical protein